MLDISTAKQHIYRDHAPPELAIANTLAYVRDRALRVKLPLPCSRLLADEVA